MEKYINGKGEVGVLVSSGYGAGWSTWGDAQEFLSMDKTLVEMCLQGKDEDEVETYLVSKGYDEEYLGGWSDCSVEYLQRGTAFLISEHDGSETLETSEILTLVA